LEEEKSNKYEKKGGKPGFTCKTSTATHLIVEVTDRFPLYTCAPTVISEKDHF
jgi:hypothetical protein